MKRLLAAIAMTLPMLAKAIGPTNIDYTTVYSPVPYTNLLNMTVNGQFTNKTTQVITTNSQVGDSLPATAQKINRNTLWLYQLITNGMGSIGNYIQNNNGHGTNVTLQGTNYISGSWFVTNNLGLNTNQIVISGSYDCGGSVGTNYWNTTYYYDGSINYIAISGATLQPGWTYGYYDYRSNYWYGGDFIFATTLTGPWILQQNLCGSNVPPSIAYFPTNAPFVYQAINTNDPHDYNLFVNGKVNVTGGYYVNGVLVSGNAGTGFIKETNGTGTNTTFKTTADFPIEVDGTQFKKVFHFGVISGPFTNHVNLTSTDFTTPPSSNCVIEVYDSEIKAYTDVGITSISTNIANGYYAPMSANSYGLFLATSNLTGQANYFFVTNDVYSPYGRWGMFFFITNAASSYVDPYTGNPIPIFQQGNTVNDTWNMTPFVYGGGFTPGSRTLKYYPFWLSGYYTQTLKVQWIQFTNSANAGGTYTNPPVYVTNSYWTTNVTIGGLLNSNYSLKVYGQVDAESYSVNGQSMSGMTTNIQGTFNSATRTLCFTNGILMRVTTP